MLTIRDSVYNQRSVADVKSPMSCWHPKKLFNAYLGEDVIVPCRKCPACRYAYAQDLQQRLNDECKAHKWNFFVTLTYDNDHLPMYYVFPAENGVYFRAYRGGKPMVDADGLELPELDFNIEDSWFSEPQHNKYAQGFGFCYKRDIQLFFKRLRIDIDRNEVFQKSKIRYFVASEYGPATFRPHYHCIISCDNERLARELPRLIRENWSMCNTERCDVQLVSGAAPEYVAKYVTGFASLPKVLQTGLTRPFHLASKHPALGSFKVDDSKIFDCFVNSAFEVPRVDPKTCEVSYNLVSYKVLSRYFRQYCGYGEGNLDYELRLFEKYDRGHFKKEIDFDGRYIECHARGTEYLDIKDSFKYKDYLWYKNIQRLLHSEFTFPRRNDCGFSVGMFEHVKFSLRDILVNMRRMFSDYKLYLLNSSYRSQELLSEDPSVNKYTFLSFYPYLYMDFDLCHDFDDNIVGSQTLNELLTRFGLCYGDVYDDGFIRLDFPSTMENLPLIKSTQDNLLRKIQESDFKKKFNDLYNF